MGVAKILGLDDPASPALVASRIAWSRWCALDPDLAVVDELDHLPAWTARASRTDKDAVLASLAALTVVDVEAVTVLTWVLLPGAVRIARGLGDLRGDVDGLVAGQLWIEASRAHELTGHGLARAILNTTRREVLAELGRGDLAKRRDRVWAEAVRTAQFDEGAAVGPGADVDDELEPYDELLLLEMDAMADKAIEIFDACLIHDLARVAQEMDAPAHRGRCGITTPAVVDRVASCANLSPTALRKRVGKALDRLHEYARVREDPELLAEWRQTRPLNSLSAGEQMDLIITNDLDPFWVKARDRAAVEESLGIDPHRWDEPA